jgi:hypothetical protein
MTHRHFPNSAVQTAVKLALVGALWAIFNNACATPLPKPTYDAAKSELKTSYKTERAACDSMAGNAKDICVTTAKGREEVAMAHLEYQYTGKSSDRAALLKARYEARYEIAEERCDDLGAQQKDVCVAEAKAERDKGKAAAKASKDVDAALEDAQTAAVKADYKVARERCDSLGGDNKDVCLATARARFDQ